ncbi:hypothetical protein PENTCL1PPCAC_25464, partial [Pristionchus entomophagus]
MDPSDSLDWYSSGLHIVEDGEEAAAAAAHAEDKQQPPPEESISSVIGSAFSGMVSSEDCLMSGLMQQQQQAQHHQQLPIDLPPPPQLLRPSVLQHTSDHQHRHLTDHHHTARHIIQSTASPSFQQQHHHQQQSVIVQPPAVTVTSSSSYGGGQQHFLPSSFSALPSSTAASNLFLPPAFMGLSFPEFEASQLQYPSALPQHQPSLDLFDPNHWMDVLDGKKAQEGSARRPSRPFFSFTDAFFPFAGQGILDFGGAAAAAVSLTAAHQQHSSLKQPPPDALADAALYLSPSLPSSLSSPLIQAPPTPKGLLVGTVSTVGGGGGGYGTNIREAVLDMEKPEDREMAEQECQVCMATSANGLHFGARTCAACAAFFRRSVADGKSYSCKGSARCNSSAKDGTGYRKICRSCRLQRCLHIGMQPENVQNKRFRKEEMPQMISDLVGKKTSIDNLLKLNFNQPFVAMGQMQLQSQQHLHQSAPQSFYC